VLYVCGCVWDVFECACARCRCRLDFIIYMLYCVCTLILPILLITNSVVVATAHFQSDKAVSSLGQGFSKWHWDMFNSSLLSFTFLLLSQPQFHHYLIYSAGIITYFACIVPFIAHVSPSLREHCLVIWSFTVSSSVRCAYLWNLDRELMLSWKCACCPCDCVWSLLS